MVRHAGEHALARYRRGHAIGVAQSVLQRQDQRVLADQRGGELERGRGGVALDEDQQQVHRRLALWIRRGARPNVTDLAFPVERDALRADPLDHRAVDVDEEWIAAGFREMRAEKRTHRACADDANCFDR